MPSDIIRSLSCRRIISGNECILVGIISSRLQSGLTIKGFKTSNKNMLLQKCEKSRDSWDISNHAKMYCLILQQKRRKCVDNKFSQGHNHLTFPQDKVELNQVNSNCFLLLMQRLNIISLFFYMY